MALVEVKNLKKYFYGPKGAVHAVDDVTMNIDAGETMGVVENPAVESQRLEERSSIFRRVRGDLFILMEKILQIRHRRN